VSALLVSVVSVGGCASGGGRGRSKAAAASPWPCAGVQRRLVLAASVTALCNKCECEDKVSQKELAWMIGLKFCPLQRICPWSILLSFLLQVLQPKLLLLAREMEAAGLPGIQLVASAVRKWLLELSP